jgi:carnitine-CoA ligase
VTAVEPRQTLDPLHASRLFAPPDRTLPKMLTRRAEQFGDRPLVTAGNETWSYAQARDKAAHFAGTLAAAGVSVGDRVALVCSNRVAFMQVFLGCAWLGAVVVPINTASRGLQLQHILSNSGAKLLIVERDFLGNFGHVELATLPLQTIWMIDGSSEMTVVGVPAQPMPALGNPCPPAALRPSELLAILYTSGTTGPSKGVCCPHAQYFWWGLNTAHLLGLRRGDVLHTTLPLFHTNALNTFFQALLLGNHVVYGRRFSASNFFHALCEHNASVTYLLGAMVPMLLAQKPHASERTHNTRIALAPGVPARFHAEFTERTGIRLLDGYGSTETNFAIGTTIEHQRPGTMGPVSEGFEARVVDDEDNDVPNGEPGELVLRAHAPFAFATGYFGMPEKTVEAWRNLWFHTGDRVVREADGYFRFIDRLKDAIRRRGENVSAFEVEQVLLGHPAVANVAVFAVLSELAEDEIMAAIVAHPGQQVSELDLVRYCEPRLPYFAVPRYLEFVADLPTTENGKVQKYKLRLRGISERTWDRDAVGYKLAR